METLLQHNMKTYNRVLENRHNPCFSGNSFATKEELLMKRKLNSHNPCFSGNSFATHGLLVYLCDELESQSLF